MPTATQCHLLKSKRELGQVMGHANSAYRP